MSRLHPVFPLERARCRGCKSHWDSAMVTVNESGHFELGSTALREGRYALAYHHLQWALEEERSPERLSLYALALAHHTGNVAMAINLCREALRTEPRNPAHFHRFAVIYLIAGNKKEAIRMLHLGLRFGRHQGSSRLLQVLGVRKNPVIPFLSRGNPLNKYLGRIRRSLLKGV